jgi:hypothetical protein
MSERGNSGEAYRDPRIQELFSRFRTFLERSDVPVLDHDKYSGQPPLFDMAFNPVFIKEFTVECDQPDSPVRTIEATYCPMHINADGEENPAYLSIDCVTSDGYNLVYYGNFDDSGHLDAEMYIGLDDILADGPGLIPDTELVRRLNNLDFWDLLKPGVRKALQYKHPKEILAYSGVEHTLEIEPDDLQVLAILYITMTNEMDKQL